MPGEARCCWKMSDRRKRREWGFECARVSLIDATSLFGYRALEVFGDFSSGISAVGRCDLGYIFWRFRVWETYLIIFIFKISVAIEFIIDIGLRVAVAPRGQVCGWWLVLYIF